jgi:hypothetical protein
MPTPLSRPLAVAVVGAALLPLLGGAVIAAGASPAAEPRTEYQRTSTVSGWGGYDSGQSRTPASLAGRHVVAVSAGDDHSLALTSDGAVTGWGWNGDGQAVPPADLRSGAAKAVGIDAGEHHSLAVLADGGVRAWGARGDTDEGQADVPVDLPPVRQVAAGRYHSLALTRDGLVRAWGAENNHGDIDADQTHVPYQLADGSHRVVDVAAGSAHSLAVDDTGAVWAWGSHDQAQARVPDALIGQRVVDVAAYGAVSMARLADGRVVTWGDNGTGTLDVPARARFVQIDVGSEVAMGLTTAGAVVVWGDTGTPAPRTVAQHAPFSAIAAGGRHELVVHRAPKTATRLAITAPGRVKRGRAVTLTVRLTGVASGAVVVKDGTRRLGTVTTARGTGRLVVRNLTPGTHRLVATYVGSATASRATSPTRTVVVAR